MGEYDRKKALELIFPEWDNEFGLHKDCPEKLLKFIIRIHWLATQAAYERAAQEVDKFADSNFDGAYLEAANLCVREIRYLAKGPQ